VNTQINTQTQAPNNQAPNQGQTQTQDEFPGELLGYIRKYINKDISLKELADLGLAIEYVLEWAVDHGYGADDKLSEIESEIETEVR